MTVRPAGLGSSDNFGHGLAYVGDLNGDGIGDLAVGAPGHTTLGGSDDWGAVWVLFMDYGGTIKSSTSMVAYPATAQRFGTSVASIGDLDGDSVNDLVVGAEDFDLYWYADRRGAVYVVFMNTDGTPKSYTLIADSLGGFEGLHDYDQFGHSVTSLGDLDGDGNVDVAVGAWGDDDGVFDDRGAVWILFLNADGTAKACQKISDTEGGFGGVLSTGDRLGSSLANLGDLDGDGVVDIAVGAAFDDDSGSEAGAIWILFLNADGTVKDEQKVSNIKGGFGGTISAGHMFGSCATAIGDRNGDGIGDLAVGAVGEPIGGPFGAIWLLHLDTDGTVLGEEVIDSGDAGYSFFPYSLAFPGDTSLDIVPDIVYGNARGRGSITTFFLEGQVTVEPTIVDFGAVTALDTALASFTVTNHDALESISGDIVPAPGCTPDFTVASGAGPFTLLPGDSLIVDIQFVPGDGGQFQCAVSVADFLETDVMVYGEGIPDSSDCLITPTALDFGTVDVGNTSDLAFTIHSVGMDTLSGTVSDACSTYSIVAGAGPFALPPGDSLVVTVRFSPGSPGTHDCTIETGHPKCSDVSVTGRGRGTWLVAADGSGDMPTIQAAVDAAINGETIQLGVGTFSGPGNYDVDLAGKSITIQSQSGAAATTMDCTGGRAFFVDGNETVTIIGIRFENASSSTIYCPLGQANINGCVFAGGYGGVSVGDYDTFGRVNATGCTFTDLIGAAGGVSEEGQLTVTSSTVSGCGYGFIAYELSDLTVNGCGFYNITNNSVTIHASVTASVVNSTFENNSGDCIAASQASPLIDGNTFTNNTSGAITYFSGHPTITDNTFVGNSRVGKGGAIYGDETGSPGQTRIRRNLFVDNSATGRGGAVFILDSTSGLIDLNTFVGNSAGVGGNLHLGGAATGALVQWNIIAFSAAGLGVQCGSGGTPSLYCNDIYGNAGGDGLCGIDLGSNISADPQFCDSENGDYTLADTSPCAGENSACGRIGAFDTGCAVPVAVDSPEVPGEFALHPNVPNPFNPTTTIRFDMAADGHAAVAVYDVAGRLVRRLIDRELPAGAHSLQWVGRDDHGASVASGIYFLTFRSQGHHFTRKLVLLK